MGIVAALQAGKRQDCRGNKADCARRQYAPWISLIGARFIAPGSGKIPCPGLLCAGLGAMNCALTALNV